MERIPLRDGFLAADVDRRDPDRWWVFAHGFGSDRKGAKATAFRAAAETSGASFLASDARGHGASSGTIEELTLSGMIEDLASAIDAHVPPKASLVVVGSSLGGVTAAWYAAEHPGRVTANVLVAPAFHFIDRFVGEIGPEAAAAWKRTGVLEVGRSWMWVPLRYGIVEDAARRDEALLAATYRTDTLIVHGMRDTNVPWRESTDFVERCPHRPIDLVLVGDGDHPLEGRGQELTEHAGRFVARVVR